jgi:hypothetical protein
MSSCRQFERAGTYHGFYKSLLLRWRFYGMEKRGLPRREKLIDVNPCLMRLPSFPANNLCAGKA